MEMNAFSAYSRLRYETNNYFVLHRPFCDFIGLFTSVGVGDNIASPCSTVSSNPSESTNPFHTASGNFSSATSPSCTASGDSSGPNQPAFPDSSNSANPGDPLKRVVIASSNREKLTVTCGEMAEAYA